ncbi:hypothetical protein AQUSIP_24480 [Aquicella siphonis]|uniref:Prolyl 4-hydroxylase alpha subunit Fe(2+) 2OG dioxygenase domain-containing protein n=1 Tax=Aquicella siphonis TaxID=254247 RepID=A0A5E4PL38_9COXI|nr:hypothetical protein [Aquicella siphonis]VVC77121.1 hypothetical protein AQUSIP_24480 [Aquicella siphonis]
MQSILNRLINKIHASAIDPDPSDNFFIEDVFPPELYAQILSRLPSDDEYEFIEHPDAVLPDGTRTRKLLDLTDESIKNLNPDHQAFWHEIKRMLVSDVLQKALVQKFTRRIKERFGEQWQHWPKMINVPIFYRDFPGYFISEHTDAPFKVITMQFYLPKDESQIHLGTSFHRKKNHGFELLKTNPFKPNSAYAFVRTDNSWHSVKQMAAHESKRDSLALTIYQKGFEYKSGKTY